MLDGNRRRELRYVGNVSSRRVRFRWKRRRLPAGARRLFHSSFLLHLRRSEPDAHRDRQEASAIRTAASVLFPTCLGDMPGENNPRVI
jgi:hypothetical protein